MSGSLPFLVYFLGPFAFAVAVRWSLAVGWRVMGAGLVAFFAAWVAVMVVTGSVATASETFAAGTFLYTILVAVAAGVFEESGRFIAFRTFRSLRSDRSWRTGLMYAVGHSGAESLVVGGSLLLTAAVLAHAPETLSPELLTASEELLATGTVGAIYGAVERLFVGLLIHTAFTLVVLLALVRSDARYLGLAIAWHAAHDVVAQNLDRLSEHWSVHAAWIGFIVVAYTWISLRLVSHCRRSNLEQPVPRAVGGEA